MLSLFEFNNIEFKAISALEVSIKNFCPKKHISSNNSCLMFFLKPMPFDQSKYVCFMYSDFLITMETSKQWKDLVDQLNHLKLHQYSFRIGLEFNLTLYEWQWSNREQTVNDHLKWCDKDEFEEKFDCAIITYEKTWCIKTVPCYRKEAFICEWRPHKFRMYNSKLGQSVTSVFYFFCLFSSGCLLIISLFLIQFCKYSDIYLRKYYDEMEKRIFNLNKNENIYFKKST